MHAISHFNAISHNFFFIALVNNTEVSDRYCMLYSESSESAKWGCIIMQIMQFTHVCVIFA